MRKEGIKKSLLAFVIGSSWLSFIVLFIGFFGLPENRIRKDNCLTECFGINPKLGYGILAPLYLGIMSAIAIKIKDKYRLTVRKSFFIIGVISAIIVSVLITVCRMYPFTTSRLIEQYFRLQIYHFFIYSVIIANIYIFLTS